MSRTVQDTATVAWSNATNGQSSASVVDDSITNAKLAEVATATLKGRTTAGTGNPEDITVSAALDLISSTQGVILYRGASSWAALAVGTSGQILQSCGVAANPSWLTSTGITGSLGATDNVVPRANGIGTTTIQAGLFVNDDSGNIYPSTTDVGALGTATNMWADLFVASGAVINFNNGDITVTHSANVLAFAGGTYTFDGSIFPAASDGAALGSGTVMWSDLFLASGGIVNFNNGDVTLTHAANSLTFAGASSGYQFDALLAPTANDGAPLGSMTLQFSDLFLAEGGVINFDNGDVTITQSGNTLTVTGGTTALDADSTVDGAKIATVGKQTIWIPASAMWARTTNGPAAVSRELTTGGDVMVKGLAFDTTTEEAAQFYIGFPKSWNKGTITFQAFWTNVNGLTTETVSWGLSAGAFTDDDAIDTTDLGTEVRVSDTWLAANDMHVTAESAAITVGNTPIDGDMVIGQVARSVANDNMTGDAELLGVKIFFTTNAATDA